MNAISAWRLLSHVSAREHFAHPGRSLLVMSSLAFGVAMTVAMNLATSAAVDGLRNDLGAIAGKAELQVTFGTGEARLPESVVDTVREFPFVAAAAAVLRGTLSFADGSGETIEVFGVDFLKKDVRAIHNVEVVDIDVDELPVATNPNLLLLAEPVATERDLGVGDTVSMTGPKGTGDFVVHGILRPAGVARVYGGRSAVMFLPSAQLAFTDMADPLLSFVHQVDIALTPGTSVSDAKYALRRALPGELTIEEPFQRAVELERNVNGLRATLLGISALAVLAATFIVYSTNVAMLAYRAPTFSVLQGLGVGAGPMRALILLEGLLFGMIGGALGVPLGFLLASFAVSDVAAGIELNYAVRVAPSTLLSGIRPMLLIYVALGGLVSLAAALLPSGRVLSQSGHAADRGSVVLGFASRDRQARLVSVGLCVAGVGGVAMFIGVTQRLAWACALGGTVTVAGIVLSLLRVVDQFWLRVARASQTGSYRIAWLSGANLVRDTERGLVAVAAISLCGAVAIAAATLPKSFRSSAMGWYGLRGDVTVTSRGAGRGWLPAALLSDYASRIAELPGVQRTETLYILHGQPFREERIAVVGLSTDFLVDVVSQVTGKSGSATSELSAGSAVLLSTNLAQRFSIHAGDQIAVDSPTGTLSVNVHGVIPDFASDQGSVILSKDLLRERWHEDGIHYVSIDLHPEVDVAAFKRELNAHFGVENGLIAYDTGDLRKMIEGVLADAFSDVDAIQLLVLLITLAGIVDLVATNVIDRRREFTLLRAVGARDGMIARAVAIEMGVLGVTAGIIALFVGALFSFLWLRFIYPILVGYVLGHDFAWNAAALVVTVSAVTAVTAGYTAARLALRSLSAEAARTN